MTTEEGPPKSERAQTDESLRVEREKADDFLSDKLTTIASTADAVISRARERADAVLAAARAKTDRQIATVNTQSNEKIQKKRALEDATVKEERADADETTRTERAMDAALLSDERQETDKDLLRERARSDDAVATRDEFLGIVSHDLRNMLGSMVGFADLIARSVSKENQQDQILSHAQRIQRSGDRMNRLIGDLVDVASIEAGVLAVTRELADPVQVVTEVMESFHAQAAASGITLALEIVQPQPPANFDPARILQVLTNLLSNAFKFTRCGTILLRVERVEEELRFTIRDSGEGIDADKLEAIFERFRQVTTNDRRGVGLGLYISKCIVQGHGGRIWAESRVGEGSTFCFTLPVATREAAP